MNNNEVIGYKFSDFIEGGRKIKKQIEETGKYPFSSSASEWMFIGDMAVYMPYIPLQQTPDIIK